MIGRIWRTQVELARADEYEAFARNVSLPMFRRQQGFAGVVMLRRGEECLVITLWRNADDIAALDHSASYKETVQKIIAQGFLFGEQTVDSYDAHLVAVEGAAV